MGCNCGGGGQTTVSRKYEYTGPAGQTTIYRTEIEARAKVARDGGTYQAK